MSTHDSVPRKTRFLPRKSLALARVHVPPNNLTYAETLESRTATQDSAGSAAAAELKIAERVAAPSRLKEAWRLPFACPFGSDQEQVWRAIHSADAPLLLALPDETHRARVEDLRIKVREQFVPKSVIYASWTKELERDRLRAASMAVRRDS